MFFWHIIIGKSTDARVISLSFVSEVMSNSVIGEMVRSTGCSFDVGLVVVAGGELWFVDVVGTMVRSMRESLDVELVREITGELSLLVGEDPVPVVVLEKQNQYKARQIFFKHDFFPTLHPIYSVLLLDTCIVMHIPVHRDILQYSSY